MIPFALTTSSASALLSKTAAKSASPKSIFNCVGDAAAREARDECEFIRASDACDPAGFIAAFPRGAPRSANGKAKRRLPSRTSICDPRYSLVNASPKPRWRVHDEPIALFGPSAPRLTPYLSVRWRCAGRDKREELPTSVQPFPSRDFLPDEMQRALTNVAAINSAVFARRTASACDTMSSFRSPTCARRPACHRRLRATPVESHAAPARRTAAARHSAENCP